MNKLTLYRKKIFLKFQEKYISEKYEHILKNRAEICEDFIKKLISFVENVPDKVATLKISILFTSFIQYNGFEANPDFLLQAKAKSGKVILERRISAKWLFEDWNSYKVSLQPLGIEFKRAIKEPQIEALCWETVWLLIKKLSIPLKVWLREYRGCFVNVEDDFVISIGKYESDTESILVNRAAVDVNENVLLPDFSYMKIVGGRFKSVELSDKDLYMTEFHNCRFENCQFIGCNMKNTWFRNTGLLDCKIKSSKIDGIIFEKCYFQDTEFEKLEIEADSEKHFMPPKGENCTFANMQPPKEIISWRKNKLVDGLSEGEILWNITD